MAGLNSSLYARNVGMKFRVHLDDDCDATASNDIDSGPTTLVSVLTDSANAAVTWLNVYDNTAPTTSDAADFRLKVAINGKAGGPFPVGVSFVNGLSFRCTTAAGGTGNPATPPDVRLTTRPG